MDPLLLPNTISLGFEYVRAVEHKYQEETSKLFKTVRNTEQEGKLKPYAYIGPINFHPIVTAYGDTVWSVPEHTRRAIAIHREFACAPLDADDDLHAVADLGGPYMQGLYFGAARLVDETVYKAFFAPALTGENCTTLVNYYDSGECTLIESDGTLVTAGSQFTDKTATVLSPTKIQLVQTIMTNNSVPEYNRYGLVNQHNINALVKDTTWGAEEAKTVRDLQAGVMRQLLGFNWVIKPDSFFNVNATDVEAIECVFWQRDAMMFARGKGKRMPRILVGPRADKNYTEQFWGDMWVGGARLRGPGVVPILLKKQ